MPQLRPYLHTDPAPNDPDQIYLVDRLGLAAPLPLTPAEVAWLELLNGENTLPELQARAMRQHGGRFVATAELQRWLDRLDAGLFLDTPRFRRIVDSPIRPPRFVGTDERDAEPLRRHLRDLFARPGGAGLPSRTKPDGSLHAALIPHIDYGRGGLSYTWAFKEVFEKTDASLFVIIGTSHYSSQRFTLTRKHFQTPLGIVPTDQEYIDKLVKHFGDGLFDDEWQAHFPEHSIELEVAFLQYLYENVKPIRIVPLVVGSFHDCVLAGRTPTTSADIAAMIAALRAVEAETREPICYIISGDLAHIGPKFTPSQRLDDALLRRSYHQDQTLLGHAAALDMHAYFRLIAAETDERNICGLPPTFATLAAIEPRAGKLLHYDRHIHPRGHESVSFASMAFYR